MSEKLTFTIALATKLPLLASSPISIVSVVLFGKLIFMWEGTGSTTGEIFFSGKPFAFLGLLSDDSTVVTFADLTKKVIKSKRIAMH